jgi:hypothetical protein
MIIFFFQIVDFPFHNLDPTNYLAAVPQMTLLRYKELKEMSGKNNIR